MPMSEIDRWGYANFLGLSEREIARLTDGEIRSRAIRNLPRETKELETVIHKEYTLPGSLTISTDEVLLLYRSLSEKETYAEGGYISSYFFPEDRIDVYPTDKAYWRRTHMEYPGEAEIIEDDLTKIEHGEYASMGVLGGRTVTFMSKR